MSDSTVAGMSRAPAVAVQHDAVTVDGQRRTFTVLGATEGPASRRLVLVFHGSKQSADAHRRFTGDALAPLAAQDEAVVAYLDGYRGNWNDARRESSFPARRRGMDDVAFARAVVERVTATHGLVAGPAVMVGYSNGGQMVLRLLHQAPELVAAAVVVAAAMPAPENLVAGMDGAGGAPVPIAFVHGTRDRIVPFGGGAMSRWAQAFFRVGGRTLSAPDTAAYFAARHGIRAEPLTEAVPAGPSSDGRTQVVRTTYRQEGVPPVVLYEVRGGGHTIPGPRPSPRAMGRTATDVTLLELVTDALARSDARRGRALPHVDRAAPGAQPMA
jgi:polyhydroxybutyrate depolymerase